MESTKEIKLLNYSGVLRVLREHSIRRAEVPTGYALSLPLPTRRCAGMPGYVMFASPMTLNPGIPAVQAAPDRWWVFSAQGGSLILYSLCKVYPFVDMQGWKRVTATAGISAEEKRADLKVFEDLMNEMAPAFFADEAVDSSRLTALAAAIERIVPKEILLQYRALAPDFFKWLGKDGMK